MSTDVRTDTPTDAPTDTSTDTPTEAPSDPRTGAPSEALTGAPNVAPNDVPGERGQRPAEAGPIRVGVLGGAMLGGSAILLMISMSFGRAVRARELRPLLVIPIAAALILLVVGVIYTPTAIEATKGWVKNFLGL